MALVLAISPLSPVTNAQADTTSAAQAEASSAPKGEASSAPAGDGSPVGSSRPDVDVDILSSDTDKDIDAQCTAAAVSWGLPLLALFPLALASQVELPGFEGIAAQANEAAKEINLQVQAGSSAVHPELARLAEPANAALAGFGLNTGSALGGLAAIIFAVVAGSNIINACAPNEGTFSSLRVNTSADNNEK